MNADSGFDIREHTADIVLSAWARTTEGLFRAGAEGLYAVLGELQLLEKTERIRIELAAPDLTDLYHDWLAEILFLFETRHIRIKTLQFETLDDTMLCVSATAVAICMERSMFDCDVKAVTYHELEITNAEGRLDASVVLDL